MDSSDATQTERFVANRDLSRRLDRWGPLLFVGLSAGLLAGMAGFVYIKFDLAPGWVEQWWALGLIVIAGGFVPILSTELDRGVISSIIGLAVALIVHTGAWTLPLWTLAYDPVARDLLIPVYLGRAVLSYILVVPLTFMTGYLAALLVDGFFPQ